jgi:hypothetical protein
MGEWNMSLFKKAERRRVFLKLGITGGPGDGKTFSGLRLATGLSAGKRFCVIDTENGSASLYADRFDFDVLTMEPPFSDDKFVAGIAGAVAEGYAAVFIDSLSHSWTEPSTTRQPWIVEVVTLTQTGAQQGRSSTTSSPRRCSLK